MTQLHRDPQAMDDLRAFYAEQVRAYWEAASVAERDAGIAWYPLAGALTRKLATEFDYPVNTVAAAFAACSPQTSWAENVRLIALYLAQHRATGRVSGGQTGDNLEKVQACLDCRPLDEGETLCLLSKRPDGALKVKAFYRNIKRAAFRQGVEPDDNPSGLVCLDRHAIRACDPDNESGTVGKTEHRLMREAYAEVWGQLVAEGHDIQPWDLQAVVWVCVRGAID